MGVEAQVAQFLLGNPADPPQGLVTEAAGKALLPGRESHTQHFALAIRARADWKRPRIGEMRAGPHRFHPRRDFVHGSYLPPSGGETKSDGPAFPTDRRVIGRPPSRPTAGSSAARLPDRA
jgi:hypothetical protein